MGIDYIVGALVSVALILYLLYALLAPERLS